jgi:tetratricopeptide (TPR) repeat protein
MIIFETKTNIEMRFVDTIAKYGTFKRQCCLLKNKLPPIIKRQMKTYSLIIITLLLISCQTQKDQYESFELYGKGIETLENLNSEGLQDYSTALNYFIKSIELNPNFLESRFWKMQCEINLGQFETALLTSNTVLNKPEFKNHKMIPKFYISSGVLERIKGNQENSANNFEKALELYDLRIEKETNDVDAILNKTTLLCYLDRTNEAYDFINSVSLDSKNQNYIDDFKNQLSEIDIERVIKEMTKIKK